MQRVEQIRKSWREMNTVCLRTRQRIVTALTPGDKGYRGKTSQAIHIT